MCTQLVQLGADLAATNRAGKTALETGKKVAVAAIRTAELERPPRPVVAETSAPAPALLTPPAKNQLELSSESSSHAESKYDSDGRWRTDVLPLTLESLADTRSKGCKQPATCNRQHATSKCNMQ